MTLRSALSLALTIVVAPACSGSSEDPLPLPDGGGQGSVDGGNKTELDGSAGQGDGGSQVAVDAASLGGDGGSQPNDAGPDAGPTQAGCYNLHELVAFDDYPYELTRVYEAQAPTTLQVDGSWLYFREGSVIYRMPLAGGAVETIRTIMGATHFDVEGNDLVVAAANGVGGARESFIYLVPVDDPLASPVVLVTDEEPAKVATDGTYLFYVDGGTLRRKLLADGSQPFELAPAVDPGQWRLEGANIYTIDDDDLGLKRVPTNDDPPATLLSITVGSSNTNMAKDGNTFYFVMHQTGVPFEMSKSLWSFTIGDVEPRMLRDQRHIMTNLRASNGFAFWYGNATVGNCVNLNATDVMGEQQLMLLDGVIDMGDVVATSEGLFISGTRGIFRVPLP